MSNRETVISRVQKELIGPGSDLFECADKEFFSDEVIADKPLLRYFSGILYPKKNAINDIVEVEVDDDSEETPVEIVEEVSDIALENSNNDVPTNVKEDNKEEQYTASTFFPSQYGISFAISAECSEFAIIISFGNYKKAKAKEIALSYNGESVELLKEFGLDRYVEYNAENKLLKLTHKAEKEKQLRNDCLKSLYKDHRNSALYKNLYKLFFKDKYRRFSNRIKTLISINQIKNAENQHLKIRVQDLEGAQSDNWWKGKIAKQEFCLKDSLWLHVKLFENHNIVKIFFENKMLFPADKLSFANEALNQVCLFQTEIKVETQHLQPFKDYKNRLYKSDEDKMLDFLFRDKLSYGIGHNTTCAWENCENDQTKPSWVSSTFLPQFNVKSQSTNIEDFDKKCLEIKQLSKFNNEKNTIISNLRKLSVAYLEWIEREENVANKLDEHNKSLGQENIEKCRKIQARMVKGIDLLEDNSLAFQAFQLANSAIYLQMFQTQWHFSTKKDGFEAYERNVEPQLSYLEYAEKDYPDPNKIPSWRPFQLAFILQCLPSFIEENSQDRDLVDLLYFPTGGGKTEAYLALSAFLIFWRRLQYSGNYDGVNIIIRYTLRLLSAQQFERATKLILACEFIRKNHSKLLGNERITIGFWVGGSTIPNKIKGDDNNCAEYKQKEVLKKLNDKTRKHYPENPFQLSNCQWCNTKIISKTQEDANPTIGHRINRHNQLISYCLNSNCDYSETKGGLPIVLVDEDIYKKPPTMLFATVDKFAQLAWKAEATALFNYKKNRKPELIIQDELHLLSGPLGSLVGLFENIILSLCEKPKIIASTATVKNVEEQVRGLYNRPVQIFPQNATNADDTFFSKTLPESKRRYIGVLPTGKTQTMTNLRLNAALLFARLELWKCSTNRADADQFWTILSYFKSLKHLGRFSNKITAELLPEIKQLQVRYLMNQSPYDNNYKKLPYRYLELTSRIPNQKIKKNLDRLEDAFEGNIENYKSLDIVLATNMISVGLDVGRLGIMFMNGMPMNTAEYIQASSRVARKNEGLVLTLYDPNNTRDLSYFESFIPFHKTFYKQVEPISVTPFAENALDKLLLTAMIAYFRHKMGFAANNMPTALTENDIKQQFVNGIKHIFDNHSFADDDDKQVLDEKIKDLIRDWEYKIQGSPAKGLFYYGGKGETEKKKNLIKPIQERKNEDDKLVAMQSMRSVEPSVSIKINRY